MFGGLMRPSLRHLVSVAVVSCALAAVACSHRETRTATPEEVAKYYPDLVTPVTISKAEPPPVCAMIGTVRGGGWTVEAAYDAIRHDAVERGANYVVLDGIAGGLFGRAFRCPTLVATPVPPPVAATDCEPSCSPGFVCLRGACVSACNPACGSGQACGPDRVCHAGK
jgi:hypothetical protein